MSDDGDGDAPALPLDPVEARVIGSLVEKARATPQNYPLTLNALRLACNQTTNRDPVVDLDERTIEDALTRLRARGLTRVVHSPSNRAAKYRHVLPERLGLDDPALALIAVLLLRGDQTVGELKARTERLHQFASLTEVEQTLDALATTRPPFVARLARRPGQKDARWSELLSAPDPEPAPASTPLVASPTAAAGGPGSPAVDDRARDDRPAPSTPTDAVDLQAVLEELAALRIEVRDLRAELDTFRAAFE